MTPKCAERLHRLGVQWLVQEGYYCFVEATAPADHPAMDGSKRCLYNFTHQTSECRRKCCLRRLCISLTWLRCEIVICLEHAGDLLTRTWCWSPWAGRFLSETQEESFSNITADTTATTAALHSTWLLVHLKHCDAPNSQVQGGALTFKRPGMLIVRRIFLKAPGSVPSSPSACVTCSSIAPTLAPTIFTKTCRFTRGIPQKGDRATILCKVI